MSAVDHQLQEILDRAADEARQDGATAIEAHHLLLALPHDVLSSVGLDHGAIRAALDREFEHSLGAVGVSLAVYDRPRATSDRDRPTQLGASAKLAMERGFSTVSRKKDLRPAHLLLGVLQAEVGTVPRALALAGVDRADLISRL